MAFELLTKLSDEAETVISQLAAYQNYTAAVATMAATLLLLWVIFQGYRIIFGMVSNPLPEFLYGMTIKFVILVIAGSTAYYASTVHNIMKETPARMAKDVAGETKVFNLVESKLEVALKNLDKATTAEPPVDNYPATYWGDIQRRWNDMISPITEMGDNIADFFDACIIVLKLMIIIAGLLYLGIILTTVVLINKTGFMLCLCVGPLFLMFAAFEKTKGWFSSWLNYTIGLGMSYVMIMFSAKVLMGILDILWKGDVSFLDAFGSLFVCIAISIVVGRVGDIASAWFGAGNISDGTTAALSVAAGGMGRRIIGGAQTIGSNAKNLRDLPNDLRNRFNTKYAYGRNKSAYNRAKRIKALRKKNSSSTSINKGE